MTEKENALKDICTAGMKYVSAKENVGLERLKKT